MNLKKIRVLAIFILCHYFAVKTILTNPLFAIPSIVSLLLLLYYGKQTYTKTKRDNIFKRFYRKNQDTLELIKAYVGVIFITFVGIYNRNNFGYWF